MGTVHQLSAATRFYSHSTYLLHFLFIFLLYSLTYFLESILASLLLSKYIPVMCFLDHFNQASQFLSVTSSLHLSINTQDPYSP